MANLTFKKGVHVKHCKRFTEKKQIEFIYPEGDVIILLQQHIGAPLEPLVKVGDRVLMGQKIGDSDSFVSVPVHSTVSGKVKKIGEYPHPNGSMVRGIEIENDFEYEEIPMQPQDPYVMTSEQILGTIREAGIVGMGGAGFPTFIKLSPKNKDQIDHIIVNGAECEPYLTSDHRVMLEESDRIVLGLSVILMLFPKAKGVIGIEDNKPDAIEVMRQAVERFRQSSDQAIKDQIEVQVLQTKYPQGAEKQLIYSITKREVPSGKLPADAGCIVQNIDTVVAIHRAFFRGRPLMRRVVTLSGENIKNPGNYKVLIGTSYQQLVEAAGGLIDETKKIVSGGPLMGIALFRLDMPVIKTSSSILLLSDAERYRGEESPCIRCGKCVSVCPMNLLPLDLDKYARADATDEFVKYKGMNCIECGSCSYICPANRYLVQSIRTTRRTILANRR